MSSEKNKGRNSKWRRRGSPSVQESYRHRGSIMSQQHSSDRGSQGTIEDRFEQFVQSQTRINTQILEILSRMTQQPQTSPFPPVVTPRELDQYELFERFRKRKPSEFSGCGDPMEADAWIIEMERIFRMLLCTSGQRVQLVTYMLRDAAEVWWMTVRASYTDMDDAVAWETFKEQFLHKFIPAPVRSQKLREFTELLHGGMTVPEDGPSSTVCAHPNKYSPTGYPSHGQMSQQSAVDNKTHSQKYVPSSIEKNERGTQSKSQKDAIKSSEYSSICKGDMSQENSFSDACGSNDYCISPMGGSQHEEDIHDNVMSVTTLQPSEYSHHIFDICPVQKKGVKLAPSFLVKNRELWKERAIGQDFFELRPGMILMKKYIRHSDQVEIIKKCRELGIGSGGFYRPGYSDGAKLHLWMMRLGRNWDPKRKYEERHSMDNVETPVIPQTFNKLVERAIQDAHAFIKKRSNVSSVEAVLPNMTPDICIVNFYTDTGKLGLHQDRDESKESLLKELPVVSFSLGDSAEFLYGDDRDVDKANKVILESGDVLIFGGKSRHIYHGVPSICSKTAPELLVNETNLRPGRLNLTFRQY
ncbi:Oxoglutarate/iron-dependent dioxygenase [Cinnamomum micranthum f. kanehirae]|uniref:Oxoglutarate/iron-dependent dioxygenase n=1 Tax=Cinnamomum micranthum f. kanehirae TaxID=337451 RepID=A0A3S4NM55_9MAGN|nr:Oxoglutarate/iron-dependent dioxygenase [Cinnamomum micranthum f. kanehirae]